ncbi:MAG: aldo/keto reductase [Sphingomicrobium sp.]
MSNSTQLGRSNVRVPPLGFGAATLGNLYRKVSDEQARDTVATALRHELTYIDTAPHYGFGLSESRLGAALEELDPDQRVVISSKVGRLLVPVDDAKGERHGFVDAAPFEPKFDYSYDAVMRSWEESRKRLRRDRIDILYAHDLGRMTHGADHELHFASFMEGGYRAMRELRDGGQVGAIGLGANEWQICEDAMREGEFDVFLLAGRYTLLEQTALDSFLPECARRQVSVVIGGPYNSGILAHGTKSGHTLHYNYEPAPEHIVERVRRLEEVSERHGVKLAAAALQFPLFHPRVASVIPGQSSIAEVEDTISLFETRIPEDYWSALKEDGLVRADAPVAESTR